MTCGRSVVFSWYLGFLHQYNWPPQYTGSLNIVECGVKHKNPNPYFGLSLCLIYIHGIRYFFCTFTLAYLYLWPPWTLQSLTINNIQIDLKCIGLSRIICVQITISVINIQVYISKCYIIILTTYRVCLHTMTSLICQVRSFCFIQKSWYF
jgi:hypothetical protein